MKKLGILAMALGLGIGIAGGALAAGDAATGKKVYNKCKACHSLKAGKNKLGPSLAGLMGSKAGAVKGYKYSKAMKNSGLTWDEATLDEFLKKPRKMIKRTKMGFAGLKKEKQRQDLIAFLKKATK